MTTYDADMSEAVLGTMSYRVENCSIERTLAVVGEKWTFLVLREAFMGVRRFADMQAATGAPRQVLSARLTRLVEEGLLRKVPYREPGQRRRDEYRLTQMGLDLYPALMALMHWGDRYLADQEGPPVLLTHRDCGAPSNSTSAAPRATRSPVPARSPRAPDRACAPPPRRARAAPKIERTRAAATARRRGTRRMIRSGSNRRTRRFRTSRAGERHGRRRGRCSRCLLLGTCTGFF